ncbi:HAMP domain-containing protein [Marinilabilia rubra]|uniref:HAMP domain-containing protein n=1 Tax=Marinilabilia rubra TaxID=2162893 RepID=UPI0011B21A74|nr:HAMP domain-containing protein [Marinilabilia rubra]
MAQQIAKGNLSVNLELKQKDEVVQLADPLNLMAGNLREALKSRSLPDKAMELKQIVSYFDMKDEL